MEVPSEYQRIGEAIWRKAESDELENVLCIASTSPGVGIRLPDKTQFIVPTEQGRTGFVAEIVLLRKQGYSFGPENAEVRYSSVHLSFLTEARKVLLGRVLGEKAPTADSVILVINHMGDALVNQVDSAKVVQSTCPNCSLLVKLKTLGLKQVDPGLYDEYSELHDYYNSSKHASKPENVRLRKELTGGKRVAIAVRYFETARKILLWYYGNIVGTVPNWSELDAIDYRAWGVTL
jgi:hypothetical protein